VQDDWIIVALGSPESMVLGQIELAQIPAGRGHVGQSYGVKIIVPRGQGTVT